MLGRPGGVSVAQGHQSSSFQGELSAAQTQLRITHLLTQSQTTTLGHGMYPRDVATGLTCTTVGPGDLRQSHWVWVFLFLCVCCMAFSKPSISMAQTYQHQRSYFLMYIGGDDIRSRLVIGLILSQHWLINLYKSESFAV